MSTRSIATVLFAVAWMGVFAAKGSELPQLVEKSDLIVAGRVRASAGSSDQRITLIYVDIVVRGKLQKRSIQTTPGPSLEDIRGERYIFFFRTSKDQAGRLQYTPLRDEKTNELILIPYTKDLLNALKSEVERKDKGLHAR